MTLNPVFSSYGNYIILNFVCRQNSFELMGTNHITVTINYIVTDMQRFTVIEHLWDHVVVSKTFKITEEKNRLSKFLEFFDINSLYNVTNSDVNFIETDCKVMSIIVTIPDKTRFQKSQITCETKKDHCTRFSKLWARICMKSQRRKIARNCTGIGQMHDGFVEHI